MADNRAFEPQYIKSGYGANGVLATQGACAPGVAGVVGVASSASPLFPGMASQNTNNQIHMCNKTSVWVHVNFGVFGNVRAATLLDYGVAPGAAVSVTVDPEVTGATLIGDGAPAASTAFLFTRGGGS